MVRVGCLWLVLPEKQPGISFSFALWERQYDSAFRGLFLIHSERVPFSDPFASSGSKK